MADEFDPTDEERREAYRHLRRASDALDDAAEELGFDDVHDITIDAPEMDLDHDDKEGLKAVTNAHSYLNNGDIERLHPDG